MAAGDLAGTARRARTDANTIEIQSHDLGICPDAGEGEAGGVEKPRGAVSAHGGASGDCRSFNGVADGSDALGRVLVMAEAKLGSRSETGDRRQSMGTAAAAALLTAAADHRRNAGNVGSEQKCPCPLWPTELMRRDRQTVDAAEFDRDPAG